MNLFPPHNITHSLYYYRVASRLAVWGCSWLLIVALSTHLILSSNLVLDDICKIAVFIR